MKSFMIWGPPGCGKTFRLVELGSESAINSDVLMLSYTKAAATELAGRIEGGRVTASTIHSRAFGALGLARASVVDNKKIQEFGRETGIAFQDGLDNDERQVGDEFLATLSYAENRMIDPFEAYDMMNRPGEASTFAAFLKSYRQWKDTFGYFDFNDMLLKCTKINFKSPPVVMLDEAQDCSPLQWAVFERIIEGCETVVIAADDDQAVHEYAGADPHGPATFAERHKARAKVLSQSHRVPRAAYQIAHDKAIAAISRRVEKVFKPADKDGGIESFADINYVPLHNLRGRDAKILVRDRYRMREVQKWLHDCGLPYSIAGGSSPHTNGYATALRGHLRDGEPTPTEQKAMMTLCYDKTTKGWQQLKGKPWRDTYRIPQRLMEFYEGADLFEPVTVVLSTIHQSKGTEADVVVLDLTMTDRVAEAATRDRDAEARVLYVGLTRTRDELILSGSNPLMG